GRARTGRRGQDGQVRHPGSRRRHGAGQGNQVGQGGQGRQRRQGPRAEEELAPSRWKSAVIYDIFAYSFAAIAVACIAAAWLRRSKRVTFIWAAGSAAIAAGSAFLDNFWPVPVFALMTLWALFS